MSNEPNAEPPAEPQREPAAEPEAEKRRQRMRELARKGGKASAAARRAKSAKSQTGLRGGSQVRTVDASELPGPLVTLDDAVRWSAWVATSVATGVIDPRTAHECSNAIQRFHSTIEKRDLQREVEQLRAEVKAARAERKGRS